MLIPDDSNNFYWKEHLTLTTEAIDNMFSYYVKTQGQNRILSQFLNQLVPSDIFQINITNVIQSIKELPSLNNLINSLFSTPLGQAAYSTYSKSEGTKFLAIEDFIQSFINENSSLEQMLDAAEELKLDNNSKKELLIAIYLLFDEKEKAIKLSK